MATVIPDRFHSLTPGDSPGVKSIPRLERLDGLEAAVGVPLGLRRRALTPEGLQNGSARTAIEALFDQAIAAANGRAAVMFSGGRDSSVVLALATASCRRLGAPDPVAVTAVYPGDEAADEDSWQRLVMRHLDLQAHRRIVVTDQRRALSERARSSMTKRGSLWPPAVHTQDLFFEVAPRSALFTGEGGDGILEQRRVTPVTLVRQDAPRVRASLALAALDALVPNAPHALGAIAARLATWELPWIRASARPRIAQLDTVHRGPLHWGSATLFILKYRSIELLSHNTCKVAADWGVDLYHPLIEPSFVAALAEQGGAWGYRGRTDMFRRLFGDLLPDKILARQSKAAFNESRWGDDERDFASSWSGEGLVPSVIDVEALRAQWLSPRPHPAAIGLVQDAWLATRSASESGAGAQW